MPLSTPHELRDPIHGLIRLTDQEIAFINTGPFQRLRRIRQLAMADLVYPGAVHTRFEHSLGTMHVAQRIISHLLDMGEQAFYNDADNVTVRLAALLHDIGHGPFSHVSEYLLERYYDRSKGTLTGGTEKIHEKVTLDILSKVKEISDLFASQEQKGAVEAIIRGRGLRDFKRDIVSSSLDADKMDYLLRDAYYAGVRYGQFDLEKIIDACRVLPRGQETYLAVDEEGFYAVEQLVLAKHHMIQQVYSHRVRTITDLMIVRALTLAIEAGDAKLKPLYTYDGSEEYLMRYLEFDDASVITAALRSDCSSPEARNIFQRLRERRLYKEIDLIPLDDRRIDDSVTRSQLLSLGDQTMSELESRIAKELRCEPWEVIVYKKSLQIPAYQSPGAVDPEAIHIITREGKIRLMSEIPGFVGAGLPATQRLHVVAPFEFPESREERYRSQKDLERRVTELILNHVGGQS